MTSFQYFWIKNPKSTKNKYYPEQTKLYILPQKDEYVV